MDSDLNRGRADKFRKLLKMMDEETASTNPTFNNSEENEKLLTGFTPAVKSGDFSVTVWNVGAFNGKEIPPSRSGLVLRLDILGYGSQRTIRCSITDREGQKKKDVPVDLWRQGEESLIFKEQDTDDNGQTEFIVEDREIPWLTIGAGTVDGKTSVGNYHIWVELEEQGEDESEQTYAMGRELAGATRQSDASSVSSDQVRKFGQLPILHYHFMGCQTEASLSFQLLDNVSGNLTAVFEINEGPDGRAIPERASITFTLDNTSLKIIPLRELNGTWVADTSVNDFSLPLETWIKIQIGYIEPGGITTWMVFKEDITGTPPQDMGTGMQ
jgi:hypothetical protein